MNLPPAASAALSSSESLEWKETPSFVSRLAALNRFPNQLSFVTAGAALLLFAAVIWLVVQNHKLSKDAEQLSQQHAAMIRQNHDVQTESTSKQQELESEIAALRTQGSDMEGKIQEKQRDTRECSISTGVAIKGCDKYSLDFCSLARSNSRTGRTRKTDHTVFNSKANSSTTQSQRKKRTTASISRKFVPLAVTWSGVKVS